MDEMSSTEEEKIKRHKKIARDRRTHMKTHTKIHSPDHKGRNKKGQLDIKAGVEEWTKEDE